MTSEILSIAIMSVITVLLRFIPFIVFGENRKTPVFITYLGRVLPFAIMGMLVVYCLKGISLTSSPFGIPEAICCSVVAALHVWKRNTLLSIGFGTLCYMILLRIVF